MAHSKHEQTIVDLDKAYEENEIGLKGVIYFGVGLLLLIIISFALMFALMVVLEKYDAELKSSNNPMMRTEMDRLPPEPRLQGAPGFGIETENGRVNFERAAPQAEYWELRKQWDSLLENGKKDKDTGTVIAMPIEEAKTMLLEQGLPAKSGPDVENLAKESLQILSDAGSGRMHTGVRK